MTVLLLGANPPTAQEAFSLESQEGGVEKSSEEESSTLPVPCSSGPLSGPGGIEPSAGPGTLLPALVINARVEARLA